MNKLSSKMCGIFAIITQQPNKYNKQGFEKIKHRGPDNTKTQTLNIKDMECFLGFHRLSIMGLDKISDQPLTDENQEIYLICNGEIYNWELLRDKYQFQFQTHSDCEIILHLYKNFGIYETLRQIRGEFAFLLVNSNSNEYYIARDPIGIRPLFYQFNEHSITISSEHKGLISDDIVRIFPPNHFMDMYGNLQTYCNYQLDSVPETSQQIMNLIHHKFINIVHDMIKSDRPLGAFLSGGLDSSLVCSIAAKYYHQEYPQRKFHMFSIGMKDGNSPDLIAAQKVFQYLDHKYGNVIHHIVEYTPTEAFEHLEDLIYQLETYDITTIRASMPMYLLSKYISQHTPIKALLTGEGSDEIFGGYAYFSRAPSDQEFEDECRYLVEYLHQYDVLRSDRSTSKWGLEVRVPFLDVEFCNFVLNIPGKFKNHNNKIEKEILRQSLSDYLPSELLWRRKEAFSDAVGYSWLDYLKQECSQRVDKLHIDNSIYDTDEETYYRYIYNKFYPKRTHLIDHIWRPKWTNVKEPSAQFLTESVSSLRLK